MECRTLLKVRNLAIGHKNNILFKDISFDICEGDCIMLCGANGSGKTTLMKALAASFEEAMMIPARIPNVPGFTLLDFVRIGCFKGSDMSGRLSYAQETALQSALNTLGLKHLADRDISTLSDGEFQKACIASALVRKVSVILLDEPTAFLDAENRISVLQTLRALCGDTADGQRTAIIFSTHDLHAGMKVCTKVIALGADKLVHISNDNTPATLSDTVSHIFTQGPTDF